ncbi:MAG TPA: gamma-glutamyl-phosphate reductase, partial [Plasticicumulans sp.]|nr:gamma-glutamyl-phosphate reductase [Plasticicumulans sp.]
MTASVQETQAGADVRSYMQELGRRARIAARAMSRANTAAKNAALLAIAAQIEAALPAL